MVNVNIIESFKNTLLFEDMKMQYLNQDFFEFPIIKKEMIFDEKQILNYKMKKDCIILETSGTTGIPLKIFWNQFDYIKSNLSLWRLRKLWYNISIRDRYCIFHSAAAGQNIINNRIVIVNDYVMSLNRSIISEEILDEYINYMIEFGIKWIQAPVSILLLLAVCIQKKGKKIPTLSYIEQNGEYASSNELSFIKSVFGVPLGNLYGSMEFNGIAFTCPYGTMHVLENNVFVEEISNRLIISTQTNILEPLIRYDLGDLGVLKKKHICKCGMCSDTLDLKYGRINDFKQIEKFGIVDVSIFNNVIILINRDFDNTVKQFYVTSKENIIILKLFVRSEDEKDILRRKEFYLHSISCLKQGFNIEIEFYRNYYNNNIRKRNLYVQYE